MKLTYYIFSDYLKTNEKEGLDDQMRGFQTRELHILAENGDGIGCSDEDV